MVAASRIMGRNICRGIDQSGLIQIGYSTDEKLEYARRPERSEQKKSRSIH